jgi:hypothetical protein
LPRGAKGCDRLRAGRAPPLEVKKIFQNSHFARGGRRDQSRWAAALQEVRATARLSR